MTKCAFCDKTAASDDAAVDAGWNPYFWVTEYRQGPGMTCPQCTEEHLDNPADDGGMLKHGHFVLSNRPKLDEFTEGYVTCALWSSTDNADDSGGEPMDANYDIEDVADSIIAEMVEDCVQFRAANAAPLLVAQTRFSQTDSQQGHDFWLTRNGHGAGFWDRGLGSIGEQLSKASKTWGSYDLYVGDDGKIYGA